MPRLTAVEPGAGGLWDGQPSPWVGSMGRELGRGGGASRGGCPLPDGGPCPSTRIPLIPAPCLGGSILGVHGGDVLATGHAPREGTWGEQQAVSLLTGGGGARERPPGQPSCRLTSRGSRGQSCSRAEPVAPKKLNRLRHRARDPKGSPSGTWRCPPPRAPSPHLLSPPPTPPHSPGRPGTPARRCSGRPPTGWGSVGWDRPPGAASCPAAGSALPPPPPAKAGGARRPGDHAAAHPLADPGSGGRNSREEASGHPTPPAWLAGEALG